MLDDIKKTLWATAGKLRANMDAAEYKHLLGAFKLKKISAIFLSLAFCQLAYAETYWDIKLIANNSAKATQLTLPDKTVYMTMPTAEAKALAEITNKFSLLSGIYPTLLLQESSQLNAFATYAMGTPTIVINKRMYDLISKDEGAAAALIGHEMSHLYFHHGDQRVESQRDAQIAGAIIGTFLEALFVGRLHISGLGADIGNLSSTAIATSFTRDQEREADRQGLIWAIQSGFDPNGASRLFAILEKEGGDSMLPFFQTHPNPAERIANSKEITELYAQYKSSEVLTSPELLALNRKIDEDLLRQLPQSDEGKSGAAAFSQKDYQKAKSNFELCSEKHEIDCLNNLGVLYEFGLGVSVDKRRAADLYKQAADKGSGLALNNYARLYASGVDGQLDTFRLLKLEKEASERGSANAMGSLAGAELLSNSSAFPQEWKDKLATHLPPRSTLLNYAKASSMRGVRDGLWVLGVYYLTGDRVPKNLTLAESYLTKSADKGDPRAVASLIYLYESEKTDVAKADAWKAKYNSPKGVEYLSLMQTPYYCKAGATLDFQKKCFQLADKGKRLLSGPAIYGYIVLKGIGTRSDPIEGNAWLLYAKNKTGQPFAEWAYDKNIQNMNQADIAKIEDRAKQIASEIN
jgi:TPR repeat protein/Zn-dependent protease with chaperone function